MTHEAYGDLTAIPFLSVSLEGIPKAYYQLRRDCLKLLDGLMKVQYEVTEVTNQRSTRQHSLLKTPYCSILDVISLWLLSRKLRQEILVANQEYTPREVLNSKNSLQDAINQRRNRVDIGTMKEGTRWLEVLYDTFALWNP